MAGFTVLTWDDIEAFYLDLIDSHGLTQLAPMLELVRSVETEGAADSRGAPIHARSRPDHDPLV